MSEEKTFTIPPKEYWDDDRWANEHYNDIVKQYPNQWIAVVDKKVVASGKSIAEVIKKAKLTYAGREFPVLFAEYGIHIYEN